ncbi:MAG: uncharacterized protein K0R15_72 [Clostridiales bacterium]|jgi:type IV pilus assembly protein PilA|nr:uncharacterized protein [Clostridiales bacterium]
MRREEENKKRKNKGFTLVELIIVIAILAVIAAIAAPNLIGNIGKARKTADVANAKVIGDAAVMALVEFPQYEGAVISNLDLTVEANITALEDTKAEPLARQVLNNIQGVPSPKSFGSASKFALSVAADGKVTVSVTDGGTTTVLYPDNDYAK